jgi:hypothetical protein
MQTGMSDFGAPLLGPPRRHLDWGPRRASYTASETVLLLLAGLALIDGLINVAGAAESSTQLRFTLALGLVAATQVCWATWLLWRPSRAALVFGCAFNVAIIALLLLARAGGGAYAASPWSAQVSGGLHVLLWCAASVPGAHPGAGAGAASLVETAGQLATILGAFSVAFGERLAIARVLAARAVPALVAVLFLSVLYGFGAHAG